MYYDLDIARKAYEEAQDEVEKWRMWEGSSKPGTAHINALRAASTLIAAFEEREAEREQQTKFKHRKASQ